MPLKAGKIQASNCKNVLVVGDKKVAFKPCPKCGGTNVRLKGVQIDAEELTISNQVCSDCGTPIEIQTT